MAGFTDEARVREKFQLTESNAVSTALVEASIDDAHAEVLRWLDPDFDVPTPEEGLVLGETLLAGAHVLRSLASGDAAGKRRAVVGGSRVERGIRFGELSKAADAAESQAWHALAPYLLDREGPEVLAATDTVPVLGGE